MKVVLVMFKDEQRREFPLKAEKTLIGRRTEAGLRIPTRDVSREHCQLILGKDKLIVRDLDSSNGTYVNGNRVDEATLKAGDRLTVGPVNFIVQIDGKPAQIRPTDAAPKLEDTDGAGAPAVVGDEDEVLDLSDVDFDLDDPTAEIQALLEDDDDEDEPPKPPKKTKR